MFARGMKALALICVLVACRPKARSGMPEIAPSDRPHLVVLLVIDQLPAWAFAAKRSALTGGFDRLLREGEWHTGQYPSPATLSSPGHALLGTGEPPASSGILANEWWDRPQGRMVRSVEDPIAGVSAHWLRVPGLGDSIAAARTGAKAVSVSLTDRAAILPLGHAGTAIWYDKAAIAFTSNAPLPWLADHARTHPISAHLQDVWTPLDRAKLAELAGVTDDEPGEVGERGFGPSFPHALADTKDPADAVFAAPIGNELVLETALAAIDGEHLGSDAAADLLVISLSAHDDVGHGWGHESWEAWDMMLRLDEQLGRFLASLDAKVGANKWTMIVTSDHGASPMPERLHGGRITFESLIDAANRAASTELGAGSWIASAKYPTIFLTAAANGKPAKDRALVFKKILLALRSYPGIERAGRTADFAGHCDKRTGEALAICLMLDPARSGELFYVPRAGWIFETEAEPLATSSGSLQPSDREVPVILAAPGRHAHPPLALPDAATIAMVQIAPILAHWLAVTAPTELPRPPK